MAHPERRPVVESYIVRIYRRNRRNRSAVAGVVEDVETQDRRAFRSVTQLFEILGNGSLASGDNAAAGRRRVRVVRGGQ
jgi:hypothetical protein